MAYLNVREHRLETKIAYVGAAMSGRATNFERLGHSEVKGDTLALYWKPTDTTTFRDCDVRVRLVASIGEASGEQVIDLLRDADGVVFVADSDPDAQERNRASLTLVREALATQPSRDVPVIVQVNKTDLADAVPAETMTTTLSLGNWPCVKASACRGEGVVETVERALESVLASLREESRDDVTSSTDVQRLGAPRSAPREGNPLLVALRQVLRETVTAEVDELERRLAGRLERLTVEARTANISGNHEEEQTVRLREENVRMRADLEAAKEQSEIHRAMSNAASALLASSVRELATELSSQRSELTALRERATSIDSRTEAVVDALTRLSLEFGQELTSMSDAVGAIQNAVRASASEVARAIDGAARSERDQIGAVTAQVKRAVDSLVAEVKAMEVRAAEGPLRSGLDALGAQTKSLVEVVRPLSRVHPRLDEVEGLLKRELREGISAVARRMDEAHESNATVVAATNAKATEVHAMLASLIEELKKPKKSWFA